MKTRLAITLLVLIASLLGYGQTAQSSVPCPGDTVDRWGDADARQAKQFLSEFKLAVQSNDKPRVAAMVDFPMRWLRPGKSTVTIRSKRVFVTDYDRIMTREIKKAVRRQPESCLVGNDRGVMIGDGEIWFQRGKEGRFGIITVIQPSDH